MAKDQKQIYENQDLKINIFECLQLDFKPEKVKKKRKVDDYDYNDPFLEAFEGEFDVVELECKLENFFVYKGKIKDDPKRIARKYNNSLKKNKLVDILQNKDQKEADSNKRCLYFEFESKLANSINPNYKYKKDAKFENLFMWTVLLEEPKTVFETYLKYRLLSMYKKDEYSSQLENLDITSVDLESEMQTLKVSIEKIFQNFLQIVADDKNFTSDKKIFNLFKDYDFVIKMIEFISLYTKFYIMKTEENFNYIRNFALDYLSAMMPEQCTNNIKIKHYISKVIYTQLEDKGYDIASACEGNFVKTTEDDKNATNILQEATSSTECSKRNSLVIDKKAPICSPYKTKPILSSSFINTDNMKSIIYGKDIHSNKNETWYKKINTQGTVISQEKIDEVESTELLQHGDSKSKYSKDSDNLNRTNKLHSNNSQLDFDSENFVFSTASTTYLNENGAQLSGSDLKQKEDKYELVQNTSKVKVSNEIFNKGLNKKNSNEESDFNKSNQEYQSSSPTVLNSLPATSHSFEPNEKNPEEYKVAEKAQNDQDYFPVDKTDAGFLEIKGNPQVFGGVYEPFPRNPIVNSNEKDSNSNFESGKHQTPDKLKSISFDSNVKIFNNEKTITPLSNKAIGYNNDLYSKPLVQSQYNDISGIHRNDITDPTNTASSNYPSTTNDVKATIKDKRPSINLDNFLNPNPSCDTTNLPIPKTPYLENYNVLDFNPSENSNLSPMTNSLEQFNIDKDAKNVAIKEAGNIVPDVQNDSINLEVDLAPKKRKYTRKKKKEPIDIPIVPLAVETGTQLKNSIEQGDVLSNRGNKRRKTAVKPFNALANTSSDKAVAVEKESTKEPIDDKDKSLSLDMVRKRGRPTKNPKKENDNEVLAIKKQDNPPEIDYQKNEDLLSLNVKDTGVELKAKIKPKRTRKSRGSQHIKNDEHLPGALKEEVETLLDPQTDMKTTYNTQKLAEDISVPENTEIQKKENTSLNFNSE